MNFISSKSYQLSVRAKLSENGSFFKASCLHPIFNIHARQKIKRNYATYNEDFEFIQQSKVPTIHFQKSLPRLPIPKLDDTCKRYLKALEPILTESELKQSSGIVAEFLKNEGPTLQRKLIESDANNKQTSYISEPWFDMYLRDRKALPINYNPTLVFIPETDERYNKILVKGTNLLISSARFMKSLRGGILEPEVFHLDPQKSDTKFFRTFTRILPSAIATYGAYLFKAFPLDMSQYLNLFGTTRIPMPEKDVLTHNHGSRHIIVTCKGHMYSMDLLDVNGKIRSPIEIASSIQTILNDNRKSNPHPVGVLTTANRDEWAKLRQHLINIGNDSILNKIDNALFVFALDKENNVASDYHKLVRLFLHGDGSNRWFDKSFSLIVTDDGTAGINFEHSWGDGVAVLRYFRDLKRNIAEKPGFHPEDEKDVKINPSLVEKLDFALDDTIRENINRISAEYKTWTTDKLSVDYLMYDEFGKEECKKFGVSPDAVMQLAFQLALYKKEARAVGTYESCSTSAFKHGRTETVRSCTTDTISFCSTLVKQQRDGINYNQLRELISKCSKTHNIIVKEAAMGQGFDRHLFALKNIWSKLDEGKMPQIFQDSAYQKINHNILSTSTLSSPEVAAGGFGPVVEDGYGIAYMIQDHKLGSVVSSYRPHRDAKEYIDLLNSAFADISNILKR